ncbi:ABC transporter substrate-binding protein [Arthrobacter monumenti]
MAAVKTGRNRVVNASATVAMVAALAVGMSGCGQPQPNLRIADTQAKGNGVLKIGMILESTGEQKFLNDSQRAAVQLAVREINDAGGLNGQPVKLLPSQGGEAAVVAAQDFIDGGADVVIGPTDSSHAPAAADMLSDAGTVLISPSNGAAALSDYSSGGFYFRTYPSHVLEGAALADQLWKTGKRDVMVLHDESAYSATVTEALKEELAGKVTSPALVSTAGDPGQAVAKAVDAKPDAVVVIAREARTVLEQLTASGIAPSTLFLGSAATGNYHEELPAGALKGSHGILAGSMPSTPFQRRVLTVNPDLEHLTFAAEAYDAVILAALAAADADDDAGASIAAHLLAVSGNHEYTDGSSVSSGPAATECSGFAECVALLAEGKRIDYRGQSGPTTFDADGDITRAKFQLYEYGANGRAVATKTITATTGETDPEE